MATVTGRDWRQDGPAGSASHQGGGAVVLAIRLAAIYPHRPPTPKELMDRHGMSQATAYRWVKHFQKARGYE